MRAFLLILLGLSFQAQALELISDKAGILNWLKQEQDWPGHEVQFEEVPLSPKRDARYLSYSAPIFCGKGACPHYIFERTQTGRWKLIGELPAQYEILPQTDSGLFRLRVFQRIGHREGDSLSTLFFFDGEKYGALP